MLLDKVNSNKNCISRYIRIHDNSKVNCNARSALQFEIVRFRIPSTNLKYFKTLYNISLGDISGLL